MSPGLKLRIVADKEVIYELVHRSLANHGDIDLQEGLVDFSAISDLPKTNLPDVFLVSLHNKKQEMASVIKIAHQLERPVFVYTDLLDDSTYKSYLKKAGAFDVLEKTAPVNGSGDKFLRRLGTKLAAVTRSAHTVWHQREKNREVVATAYPEVPKVQVTGRQAKVALVVCMDGDDPNHLIKLMGGLKRLEGIVLLICHRIPDDRFKAAFERLDFQTPYHLVRASTGLQLNDNTAVLSLPMHLLTVGGNHQAVVGDEVERTAKTDFIELLRSTTQIYGERCAGVLLGNDIAADSEKFAEAAEGGAMLFVQLPDNRPGLPSVNNVRMLAGSMLPLALRRHLEKLLA